MGIISSSNKSSSPRDCENSSMFAMLLLQCHIYRPYAPPGTVSSAKRGGSRTGTENYRNIQVRIDNILGAYVRGKAPVVQVLDAWCIDMSSGDGDCHTCVC